MSDPVNPFTQQAPDTEAPATSATPGAEIPEASATPGADQQAYGQQQYGQQAYAQPMYAVNPAVEKIRSNASMARLLAILSFLFGGLLLSGGMWFWANNMLQEAQTLGAPHRRRRPGAQRPVDRQDLLDHPHRLHRRRSCHRRDLHRPRPDRRGCCRPLTRRHGREAQVFPGPRTCFLVRLVR